MREHGLCAGEYKGEGSCYLSLLRSKRVFRYLLDIKMFDLSIRDIHWP